MQIEGLCILIIGGKAVFQDIVLIAITDSNAVQPDVVIYSRVNESFARGERIAVCPHHPVVEVRHAVHFVEIVIEGG